MHNCSSSYNIDHHRPVRLDSNLSGAHPLCQHPLVTQPCVHVQLSNVKTLFICKENKLLHMNFEMYSCRQMVARTVLDTLRQVSDVSNDIEAVFAIVARLAQDVGKLHIHICY